MPYRVWVSLRVIQRPYLSITYFVRTHQDPWPRAGRNTHYQTPFCLANPLWSKWVSILQQSGSPLSPNAPFIETEPHLYWNCCVWKWWWAIPTTRKQNPFIKSSGDVFGKVGGYTHLEKKKSFYKKMSH
jgi:hypothetical protein